MRRIINQLQKVLTVAENIKNSIKEETAMIAAFLFAVLL